MSLYSGGSKWHRYGSFWHQSHDFCVIISAFHGEVKQKKPHFNELILLWMH